MGSPLAAAGGMLAESVSANNHLQKQRQKYRSAQSVMALAATFPNWQEWRELFPVSR
jgi:hypothetical protein